MSKKDAYDQLLMNFTFNQLLENIDMFLNTFSQERSSVFLLEVWGFFVMLTKKLIHLTFNSDLFCCILWESPNGLH